MSNLVGADILYLQREGAETLHLYGACPMLRVVNKSVCVPTHCGQVLFHSRVIWFGMALKVTDENGNG